MSSGLKDTQASSIFWHLVMTKIGPIPLSFSPGLDFVHVGFFVVSGVEILEQRIIEYSAAEDHATCPIGLKHWC